MFRPPPLQLAVDSKLRRCRIRFEDPEAELFALHTSWDGVGAYRRALSAAVPFDFLEQEIIQTALSPNGQRHHWQMLYK